MGAQAVKLSNIDIDNAMKNKDFEVLFQPIFDLENGALARMETFVRWRHASLGLLPPGAFISFFETQGRMSELTRYVLNESLEAYLAWRGPFQPGFSINLALTDLGDEGFAAHLTKLLRDKKFPADLVTLECPMPTVDTDLEVASAHFEILKKTGARLAIEVRGRANDLLRNIDPFPFDEIKTGGSSILRFARTVRGPGLSAISDLLDIAKKSNSVISAVGVEDQASLSALRGLGFSAAQGNHLGHVGAISEFRPGHVNDVRKLLDLEPLDSESLQALFRTASPSPNSSVATADPASKENDDQPSKVSASTQTPSDKDDALLKRLNERVAQQNAAENNKPRTAPTAQSPEEIAAEKKARAREKAKALILAKRAKERETRKAAAIERAKAKLAYQEKQDLEKALSEMGSDNRQAAATTPSLPPSQAPKALQDRLQREFSLEESGERALASEASGAEADDPTTRASEQSGTEIVEPSADQSAATNSVVNNLKLKIQRAGAYFQPGIKVQNPTLSDRAAKAQAASFASPQTDPINVPSAPDLSSDLEVQAPSRKFGETIADNNDSTTEQSPADSENVVTPADAIGDLHGSSHIPAIKTPGAARKKRGFLQRKVFLYPTHFWPQSWRRHWARKRREAAQ